MKITQLSMNYEKLKGIGLFSVVFKINIDLFIIKVVNLKNKISLSFPRRCFFFTFFIIITFEYIN